MFHSVPKPLPLHYDNKGLLKLNLCGNGKPNFLLIIFKIYTKNILFCTATNTFLAFCVLSKSCSCSADGESLVRVIKSQITQH